MKERTNRSLKGCEISQPDEDVFTFRITAGITGTGNLLGLCRVWETKIENNF